MKRDRYRPIYFLLIAAGFFACADILLPKQLVTSRVVQVQEHRFPARNHSYFWTAVRLENGAFLWTQRVAEPFLGNDSWDLQVTALGGSVVRYRRHAAHASTQWHDVEAHNEANRAFLVVVILLGLLLLYPGWSVDNKMLLRGVLGVVSGAWALTQFATGGHVYKLQLLWGG